MLVSHEFDDVRILNVASFAGKFLVPGQTFAQPREGPVEHRAFISVTNSY